MSAPIDDVYRMLDAFTSVGARQFDVTFLDMDGSKRGFRKGQSVMQLRNSLPKLLPGLTERRNSIVIRPHSEGNVTLVQLDDLDAAALKRLESVAFLTHSTSPGNFQAWVAVATDSMSNETRHTTDSTKDLARYLRKGVGADLSASGATRLSGTFNYKRKYEPDFPAVTIIATHPGRIVTPGKLEQLGLLAAPELFIPPKLARTYIKRTTERKWPSYEMSLAGAPPNAEGTGPSRSHADFWWCKLAAQRHFTVEEIAAELLNVSEKAREKVKLNDPGYVTITAQNGAAAAARGRERQRG